MRGYFVDFDLLMLMRSRSKWDGVTSKKMFSNGNLMTSKPNHYHVSEHTKTKQSINKNRHTHRIYISVCWLLVFLQLSGGWLSSTSLFKYGWVSIITHQNMGMLEKRAHLSSVLEYFELLWFSPIHALRASTSMPTAPTAMTLKCVCSFVAGWYLIYKFRRNHKKIHFYPIQLRANARAYG